MPCPRCRPSSDAASWRSDARSTVPASAEPRGGPLEEAAALFAGMDMRFWLDRAEAALGDRPRR